MRSIVFLLPTYVYVKPRSFLSLQVSQCQAQLTALSPVLVELKAAVDQANQQGEAEAKRQQHILEEAAKKLETERLAKAAEEEKMKKEVAQKKKDDSTKSDTSGCRCCMLMLLPDF